MSPTYRRPFSLQNPRDLRNHSNCGLQEAQRLIEADRLLDEIDAATNIDELRNCLRTFTQMVTGRD